MSNKAVLGPCPVSGLDCEPEEDVAMHGLKHSHQASHAFLSTPRALLGLLEPSPNAF
jgi:hypothetical protein